MTPLFDQLLQQTITFAAIMDPIGVSAIMLGMLPHSATHSEVARIAWRSTLTVVIAFVIVFFTGDMVLHFFGIDQNSLKVIGGIVLLMMAIDMLGNSEKSRSSVSEGSREDISVIPLGIPIIFGAGLFTTIIIFKQQAQSVLDVAVTIAAFLLNALVVYLVLRYAVVLRRWMGLTAEKVVTKLMGLITGAIAVQFIIGGIVLLGRHYLEG